jgi:hypothetical protein
MRTRRQLSKLLLLAAPLLALAACQKPDVGQECGIQWGVSPEPDAYCPTNGQTVPPSPCFTVSADYFESGNVICENLVCIISPASAGTTYDRAPGVGYCSKPCVSNDDCFESDTGLVCRQTVLDPEFIEQLKRTDPTRLAQYLGQIQFSSFCAVP